MTETSSAAGVPRLAWNKGKITGPKPPLRPSHIWAIRAKLDLEKRTQLAFTRSDRRRAVGLTVGWQFRVPSPLSC
jgi:hypothetical protein